MSGRLQDKVAFIAEGAHVAILARDQAKADAAVSEIEGPAPFSHKVARNRLDWLRSRHTTQPGNNGLAYFSNKRGRRRPAPRR